MPFKKRRKCNNGNTKEKKSIATRLMIISLKIDDYIYKNKPISVQDAQMYIEEIATYKLKCLKDERSMQVIEKLTLFMKSIIKEYNSKNNSNTNDNIESNIISEAVADTNTLVLSGIRKINKEITRVDVDNIKETSQNKSLNDDSTILNKHLNPYTNYCINDNVGKESLTEENDSNKEYNKETTLNETNTLNITKYTTDYTDINNSDKTITGNIENTQKLTIDNNKCTKDDKVAKLTNICKCALKNLKEISKINETQTQKEIQAKTKRCTKKRKDATNKEVKRKNMAKERNGRNTKIVRERKKKCEVIKKDKINIKDTVPNKSDSNAYKPTSILEDKEVIDVSWIENVKYVREISKEEYNLTVDETFWGDLTMPVDWNFNDFDCTD